MRLDVNAQMLEFGILAVNSNPNLNPTSLAQLWKVSGILKTLIYVKSWVLLFSFLERLSGGRAPLAVPRGASCSGRRRSKPESFKR